MPKKLFNRLSAYTLVEVLIGTAVLSLFIIIVFKLYSYGNIIFNSNYWKQKSQRELEFFYENLRNELDSSSNFNQAGYTNVAGYMVKSIKTFPRPLRFAFSGGVDIPCNSSSLKPLMEFQLNEADTSGLYSTMSDESWSPGKSISIQYSFMKGAFYESKTVTYPNPTPQIIFNNKKVLDDIEKFKIIQVNDPEMEGHVINVSVTLKNPRSGKRINSSASFSVKVGLSPEATASFSFTY